MTKKARMRARVSRDTSASTCARISVLWGLLLVCTLFAPLEVEAWITLDGGENVTLHGNTNVGPPDTLEKYDLNVYGDVRVGRAESLDPFAVTPGMLVEGSITASRIVLKDSGSGDAELDEASALLSAASEATVPDFVFVATAADVSSLGFTENHTVGFYRQEGSESDPDNIALSDIFTVKLGVRDLEDGTPNKGHVDINVAGDTSHFGLRAKMGEGNSATLTFSESVEQEEGSDEDPVGFRYTLGTDDSKLSVGGNYSLFSFIDERPADPDESMFDHYTSYMEAPRAKLNASSDGSTAFTLQAPKTSRGSSGFRAGEHGAKIEMRQGDTAFFMANVPEADEDVIKFGNETEEGAVTFLEVFQSGIQLIPQVKDGAVIVGAEDADTESGGSDYKGATLAVGKLEIMHQSDEQSPYGAVDSEGVFTPFGVMELTTRRLSSQAEGVGYPLYMSSENHVKVHTPNMFVGDGLVSETPAETKEGVLGGGAIKLNGTGVTQTGQDFPLYLHTENTDGKVASSGVRLSGTYKFGVGDINVIDDATAGTADSSEVARSSRRITSAGTLRITTFDPGHAVDEISGYGEGSGNSGEDSDGYVEVFVDGNEVTGQSRMRVGNAVWHDGYGAFTDVVMDGVTVVEETEAGPGTLIAVGSDLGNVGGAPTEEQSQDPVPKHHSGLLVIRSKREVRIDDGSKLRIGVPSNSIYINGTDQSMYGDDSSEPLKFHAHLGLEVGSVEGELRSGMRDRVTMASNPELGSFGHPSVLLRDIEVDGCSIPNATADLGDDYTKSIYAARKKCVSRIGIVPTPEGETANPDLQNLMGRYEVDGEYKELYLTSNNYVDVDGRSRLKVGGLFFDGSGAQPGDFENAFSESSDRQPSDEWDYSKGDKKNTLRGDSGLFVDGGRQSGNVSISGGLSRVDGVKGGDVLIRSGGSGATGVWSGDSGAISLSSSPGGEEGRSGDVSISTGNTTEGKTGDVTISSGYSHGNLQDSGAISLIAGGSEQGQGGDINLQIDASQGSGRDGGSTHLTSGSALGKGGSGGSVFISSGDAMETAEAAGGDISIAAGDSLTTKDVLSAHGGQVLIQSGHSAGNSGGEITIISGNTSALNEGQATDMDGGYTRSGNINITSSYVDNAYTGSVSLSTGDSLTGISGDVGIKAGSGMQSGANVTIAAGDAHDSASFPVAIQSGTSYFKGMRQVATIDAAAMAGTVELVGGKAVNGNYGHGGNVSTSGGQGSSFGGHAHISGGAVNDNFVAPTNHGGSVFLTSGSGSMGTIHSGSVEIKTSDGGNSGGAGSMDITTGKSFSKFNCAGQFGTDECIGGNITVSAGENVLADGAFLVLNAGNTTSFNPDNTDSDRDTALGGPVLMNAGSSTFGAGGQINITAGSGSAQPEREIHGIRYGADYALLDEQGSVGYGGNVTIRGGASAYDHGGSVNLVSGEPGLGVYSTSGNITMVTPDATNSKPAGAIPDGPDKGISGSIFMRTGEGKESSGNVSFFTGNSTEGTTGHILLHAGFSMSGDGGSLNFTSGHGGISNNGTTSDARLDDGDITLEAGKRVVMTGDFAVEMYGGNALDDTYTEITEEGETLRYGSVNGNYNGGYLYFQGGDSEHKSGGNITVRGGKGLSNDGGDISLVTGVGNSTSQSGTYTAEYYSHDQDLYNRANSNYDHDADGHRRATNRLASSGELSLATADAFPHINRNISSGVSGSVSVRTGLSGRGDSGSLAFSTGDAVMGVGGNISFSIGNGTDVDGYGESSGSDGGSFLVQAGTAAAADQSGGHVVLSAGLGVSSSNSTTRGGDVMIRGGNAEAAKERSLLDSQEPWLPYERFIDHNNSDGYRRNNEDNIDHGNEDGGAVYLRGGDSDRGIGGSLVLTGGESQMNDGGDISLIAGKSNGIISTCNNSNMTDCDNGGRVNISGGEAFAAQGGDITLTSGFSTTTTSGNITIASASSGSSGVSGNMSLVTGSTSAGESGKIELETGEGVGGSGGDIRMAVGTGNFGNGGDVLVSAGETTDYLSSGGKIELVGGMGSNVGYMGSGGGIGGDIILTGGEALGANNATDVGGDLMFTGGRASNARGGDVALSTGYSDATNSGSMRLATVDSGSSGVSGGMSLFTGSSVVGESGEIEISTGGDSFLSGDLKFRSGDVHGGKSGDILIESGDSSGGVSGDIHITAGESTKDKGGDIEISAGRSTSDSDGPGGDISLVSGRGHKGGKGGDLNIVGGISGELYGRGGDVSIDGGHSESGMHGQVKIGTESDEVYMGEVDYSSDLFFYGHSFAYGALSVGEERGTPVTEHFSYMTEEVTIGTLLPSQSVALVLQVDGVKVEDNVSVNFSGRLGGRIVMSSSIIADGEVEINMVHSGSPPVPYDIPSGTFRVNVFQYRG